MSKQSRLNSVSVIIEIPLEYYSFGNRTRTPRQAHDTASDIVRAIKRHVAPYHDEAEGVFTREDREDICSHCGNSWTECDPEHNGGCCDADEAAQVLAKVTQ